MRTWLLQVLLNYNWRLDANFPNFDFIILIYLLETQTTTLGKHFSSPFWVILHGRGLGAHIVKTSDSKAERLKEVIRPLGESNVASYHIYHAHFVGRRTGLGTLCLRRGSQ